MDEIQRSMGMVLNNTPWHAPITEKPTLGTTKRLPRLAQGLRERHADRVAHRATFTHRD